MQNFKKILALLLAAMMVFALVACNEKPVTEEPEETPAAPEATTAPEASTEPEVEEPAAPLVVAYSPFSAKFSPFYADTAYDQDVVGLVSLGLMTTDRMGGIIFNAIEGETVNYNGTDYLYTGPANLSVKYDAASDTTTYTAKLREDLTFSDGDDLTADDVIFTYYVLLDPAYVGSTTLSSYDIVGLKDYQTQTTSEVYEKYAAIADAIYAAGSAGYVANEQYTEEQYNGYWELIKQAWIEDCQAIVDYVAANYGSDDYVQGYFKADLTWAEVKENAGLTTAFGMAMWGYGAMNEDGTFTDSTGKVYDMSTTVPTAEDYYNAAYAAYEGDPAAYWAVEAADSTDVVGTANTTFIREFGSKDEAMGGQGVKSITGITKVDDYTVQVVVNGYSAPAVYSILGITIAPLHYYGDVSKYDYENGKYGFDLGDLSGVQAKTEVPLGAGPYKFVSYADKVVTFEANENYYRGCPKIANILFKETNSAEVATALKTGDADAGELTGSRTRFEEVASYNSNKEISGDVITTSKVDNLGYGYIGINADTVNIGGGKENASTDASKALRKALATILSVYRDVSIDTYYGEAASVIQYPISNTSWAAPQASDEGYQLAFSVDAQGNPLYTAEMTAEEKYAAAKAGALTWFEAAGYTVADGKVTAAPAGGATTFTATIPADGIADHPSFDILTMSAEALGELGIELIVNDLADSSILWDMLDAGEQEIWCAAWGSTIDPDMYQVYHSSGVVGEGGSDSNHYHLRDAQLDELIVAARESDDQSYRKSVYKQCLDLIIDWAVEIPAYQRQNCIVFSTERINIDTLTPDITTFWGWMNDIELLEMN
ncbi:MAG: ABC transporter substrate-binding protein [Clostridiales bacterium]|nr:ABC transporter substrate-binding protein [Clostridiales bacterium]